MASPKCLVNLIVTSRAYPLKALFQEKYIFLSENGPLLQVLSQTKLRFRSRGQKSWSMKPWVKTWKQVLQSVMHFKIHVSLTTLDSNRFTSRRQPLRHSASLPASAQHFHSQTRSSLAPLYVTNKGLHRHSTCSLSLSDPPPQSSQPHLPFLLSALERLEFG